MFAIAWGLLYFLTVYLLEMQSGLHANGFGISLLYAVVAFLGVPLFLRYFEAQKNKKSLMISVEKIIFSASLLAIGTQGGIVISTDPVPVITGGMYILFFLLFSMNLDESYRKIGVYSESYYRRVFGEFPLTDKKMIAQFRLLIYMLPVMLIVAIWFWNKL
ncbi:MAG: hypothetical protein EA349_04595 [Halomonadaceae bacterium]|nr:MAG: hypothetical protein EA349_04595 [Halomonadaceae bacterium]